jgi:hypothetical protein
MSTINNFNKKNDILSLKKTFSFALNNFKDNYINYKLNSDNDEFKNIFLKSKNQVQEIDSDLVHLSEEIINQILTNDINNENEIKSIEESEEIYDITVNKLNNIGDKNRASNKLINDYEDIYERQFYKNFQIICGVFVMAFLTYKMKNI